MSLLPPDCFILLLRLHLSAIICFTAQPFVHQLAPRASNLPISIYTASRSLFVSRNANHLIVLIDPPTCKIHVSKKSHNTKSALFKIVMFSHTCAFELNCFLPARSHGNSYVFYEVANFYEFVRPHSYDFV